MRLLPVMVSEAVPNGALPSATALSAPTAVVLAATAGAIYIELPKIHLTNVEVTRKGLWKRGGSVEPVQHQARIAVADVTVHARAHTPP